MHMRLKEQNAEKFMLSEEHIEFLRQATVIWDSSEFGAPIVEPGSLYQSRLQGLHTALQIMLRTGSIQPGTYRIPNRLRAYYKESSIQSDFLGNSIEIPQGDEIEFTLTAQHIELLRRANTNALTYFGACGFNSRCPYGNLASWELEIAHVLGLPVYRDQNGSPIFTAQELEHFRKLHQSMLLALPVFLAHVRIETGEFVRYPSAMPVWERFGRTRPPLPRPNHRSLRVENKQLRLKGSW